MIFLDGRSSTGKPGGDTRAWLDRASTALIIALGAVLLCRLWLIIGYPLGVDQGVFAWFGRVLADGGRPYLDAWDTKGPGVFAISAAVEWTLPGSAGVRIFDVLLQLGAAIALVRSPVIAGRLVGWLAAMTYLAGYASLSFHETSQPDSWAAALLVIGIVPTISIRADGQPSRFPKRLLLCCACIGTTVLFKPTYAIMGVVPLAALLARRGDRDTRWWRSLVLMAAGFLVPLVACAAWLLASGALTAMWDVVVRWNARVYLSRDVISLGQLPRAAVAGLLENVSWWPLALMAPLSIAVGLRDKRAWMVGVWMLAAAAEITVQRKFWGYHWTPLLGPLAVAMSFAVIDRENARADWKAMVGRLRLNAVLIVLLGVAARTLWHDRSRLLGDRSSSAVIASLPGYNDRLLGFDDLARAVERETNPSDPVFFDGTLAIGNYQSHRPAVGRFALSRPMLDGEGTAIREAYRREFWEHWRSLPPRMVVTYSSRHCARYPELRWTCLDAWPELRHELESGYDGPEKIGAFELYRLRRAASSTTGRP